MRNVYEAIQFIKQAWSQVSNDTIRNCWQHCGITGKSTQSAELDLSILTPIFNDWRAALMKY